MESFRIELKEVRQSQATKPSERETEFCEGYLLVIFDTYHNQCGREVTVTRVHSERVYFTLDERLTYKLQQNVKGIA